MKIICYPLAARVAATLCILIPLAPAGASEPEEAAGVPPCESDERHRQFDFWIGQWEVRGAGGKLAGTNTIEKTLNGCLLIENWTSVGGGSGKSVNYFDPGTGKWKQDWIDAGGGVIHYEGEFRDGAMRFEGVNYNRDGSSEPSRMAFTPLGDGTVRQFIEQSSDGGESWYVWFDAIYSPIVEEPAAP